MPADAGAGVITDHQSLLEYRGSEIRERGCALAQRQQEFRNRLRGFDTRLVEIVAPAVRHGFAIAAPAVKLKRLERQGGGVLEERAFLVGGDELGAKIQPAGPRVEQARLCA